MITRVWAMPTANTFDCPPIGRFVRSRLERSKVSVDPFARNKRWATYTNDLNPSTLAEKHMDVLDFLLLLVAEGVSADLVIFDPPYSLRQVKECYDGIGKKVGIGDTQRNSWRKERDAIDKLLLPGGVVLSFGWNSQGMGTGRGYQLDEVLLVCHGAGHNDTICVAETKLQPGLGL